MDPRSSSALFKRAEQLKRWEESDTNKQSAVPKRATRIQFSPGIVFLAACTAGDKDEVQRLLKLGADINTSNVDGLTALHQACIDDNFDMVQFLVEHGADVNRGDNEGWTPLHATASCGFASIARHLLENGADVAAVNYDGELAIDIAESDEMEKLLQTAIDEKGVDCEKSRSAEVIKLSNDSKNWAANGYSDVRDPKTGGTPLHVAAAKGYIDVAKTLLEDCNVDPDSVDYEGYTPLHAAALWGQKEAAAILFKFGADPNIKNYSGQTCLDLVDPSISAWLKEAAQKAPHRVNNNVKRTPQKHDVKSVELQINNSDKITIVNDKPPSSEIITKIEGKPPKARPPSPDPTENSEIVIPDEPPSWRRSASFRSRLQENTRENKPTNNNVDTDPVMLRRTHSVEAFYQRYREVTARIKATSCPSIPPVPQITLAALELWKKNKEINNATNDDSETRVNDKKETDTNALTVPTTSSSAVTNNTTTRTTVRRSFVPPVRDDESETQRKAHAKRVRETRRSTQGVTLDEIKSAEQLVKNKTNNGTTDTSNVNKKEETRTARALAAGGGDTAVSLALACVTAAATATIAPNSERHPSWRLRFDPNNKFELEDANQPPRSTTETEATVTLPLRRPPSAKDNNRTGNSVTPTTEEEKDRESSVESKSSSNASSSSTQAALNVIQRRRRPKRRSTGVGHVDMDDIVNDRVGGSEGDGDSETAQSGSERTEEPDEKDYKALYEASRKEVKQLRLLLSTSEQQLREARATITRLTQVNQNSLSEIEKRERRAMERKLSEMEEELKQLQKLKAENERLRAENRALTRVVSKLTNSAAK
ncbi:protein phosphatase 1 regulatory subunit 12C-like isoform X6 [Pieris napi]|uniref:protein phosphatase 1 regulatory subunit 12C-like isoform X6 n=1 Tax=Pieris napi TaxID=78633 RepID=UPI001FBB780E|nr:protein phosphatase 1 regulatory subunit 12C-like isoform X6 [Pieris napi]